ncbi:MULTISPECIES: hypothetical protein [unclassified Bartonella]|uniref:hypothetical protein n=1 Tax=unclassified Bartonella TaxID=2645622 RepID=UPI0035CE8F43
MSADIFVAEVLVKALLFSVEDELVIKSARRNRQSKYGSFDIAGRFKSIAFLWTSIAAMMVLEQSKKNI